MKVEVNLTLVKGQEAAGEQAPRKPRINQSTSRSGIELLISQENQQASRLDPASLPQARTLLTSITRRMTKTPSETLSRVHLLDSSCLIRLP
ncbi:MAG: hypothetical protein ACUVXF_11700 [Desulfobaccales bacterium]